VAQLPLARGIVARPIERNAEIEADRPDGRAIADPEARPELDVVEREAIALETDRARVEEDGAAEIAHDHAPDLDRHLGERATADRILVGEGAGLAQLRGSPRRRHAPAQE